MDAMRFSTQEEAALLLARVRAGESVHDIVESMLGRLRTCA